MGLLCGVCSIVTTCTIVTIVLARMFGRFIRPAHIFTTNAYAS